MAEENNQDKPKIIVDDDWKAQAQAEKERLAETAEQPEPAGGGPGGPREIPPASFDTLVGTLATQALMALGGYQDPRTGHRLVDLDLAKHHIDTLRVLEEKTRGNLTDEERAGLDRAMYETRMAYVEISQRVVSGPGGGPNAAGAGATGGPQPPSP